MWRSACADVSALAKQLGADDWWLPTDCPGWSVHDVMAHNAALESELAGHLPLRVQIDKRASHLKSPAGIYTERGVVARRERTPEELISEFDQVVAERTAQLAEEPLDDPDGRPPITPAGIDWSWATLLRNRPLDIWVHEQDIRRAVGKPGALDSAAARHSQTRFADALGYVVAKLAAAPSGTRVLFDVTGPVSAVYAVGVDEDGRGSAVDPADVSEAALTVRLTLDTETFTILSAGRRDPSRLPVKIEGEEALAARILASMPMTL